MEDKTKSKVYVAFVNGLKDRGLKKNCYLEYNDEILILGSCCIKRFLPKNSAGRTCDECGKPHRNRKINKCNDCKIGYCIECWKPMDISSYDRCAECYFKNIKLK